MEHPSSQRRGFDGYRVKFSTCGSLLCQDRRPAVASFGRPGVVAQWLERGTHNPLVVGSIPTRPTLFMLVRGVVDRLTGGKGSVEQLRDHYDYE